MKVKQHIPKELRYTVRDFDAQFPNDDACLEFLKQQQFPNGTVYCAKCKQERKHYRVTGRPAYACDHCGKMISPMAGTIFEKSSTPLRTWFYAIYLMSSTRCGISAKQIQRETGVTYKTAWRMFRQIRTLLSDGDLQLEGPTVEVDETYWGGVRKYGRGRRIFGNKTPIVGIVQRQGKVVAKVIKNAGANHLLGAIRKHIVPGSTIYTDEWKGYRRIPNMRDADGKPANFTHFKIRHKWGHYVKDGHIHTNSVEGFWSLVKRGINGVYHSVSPEYLQSYLDEFTFRYNRRHDGNLQFRAILKLASERTA
ncbi:MAG: IS1595 family transposase [Candidatus Acidiferrales bacterium]